MKITKFVHSCLLVETTDRVALFDPGSMSESALNFEQLSRLDDVFITHIHGDHVSLKLLKELVAKFPNVRISSTNEVVKMLEAEGIKALPQPPEGVSFFNSPHEIVEPMFSTPEEVGIHYLGLISHPGDSHSFAETKPILALPVSGPWGSTVKAVNLALELKPQHILPIHDWHWHDAAREQTYNRLESFFAGQGITFHKLETGQPIDVNI